MTFRRVSGGELCFQRIGSHAGGFARKVFVLKILAASYCGIRICSDQQIREFSWGICSQTIDSGGLIQDRPGAISAKY